MSNNEPDSTTPNEPEQHDPIAIAEAARCALDTARADLAAAEHEVELCRREALEVVAVDEALALASRTAKAEAGALACRNKLRLAQAHLADATPVPSPQRTLAEATHVERLYRAACWEALDTAAKLVATLRGLREQGEELQRYRWALRLAGPPSPAAGQVGALCAELAQAWARDGVPDLVKLASAMGLPSGARQ